MVAAAILGDERVTTVPVTVPLDAAHAADLRQQLLGAIGAGSGPVVLDLSATTVADSAGFATLVSAHVRAAHLGRSLRVAGADDRTRRLLWRARLGRLVLD